MASEARIWARGRKVGVPAAAARRHALRGSVIAISNGSGAVTAINSYDEYGIPGPANSGRFQYTGQMRLSELGAADVTLYHYKARAYSPTLGRFLQTDPIGYADGMNLYAYVGNDPVNLRDPSGMTARGGPENPEAKPDGGGGWDGPPVVSIGFRASVTVTILGGGPAAPSASGRGGRGAGAPSAREKAEPQNGDIVVTAKHHYAVFDFAFCSADDLFAQFSKPGNSAPGAPAAEPGTRTGITLSGGNPITQFVDPGSRTITNVTQEGHRYHPGEVEIRVSPRWFGSTVSIVGRGNNSRGWENRVFGRVIFTGLAARSTIACTFGAK